MRQHQIQIDQRDSRKAREVTQDVKYAAVTLRTPAKKKGSPFLLTMLVVRKSAIR